MKTTLRQLRDEISDHLISRGPYAHNIIGLILQSIAKQYGKAAANEAILDLGLEKHGWKVRAT